MVVEDLPEDHLGVCGSECVDLFANLSTVSAIPVFQVAADNKVRLIVLEGVKGDNRVVIRLTSPASEFDEFAPEAQEVIDSVEWTGS